MLSLSRKVGERIVIGKGDSLVELVVTRIGNGKVVLGLNAPKDIPIYRKEIYDEIQKGGGDWSIRQSEG